MSHGIDEALACILARYLLQDVGSVAMLEVGGDAGGVLCAPASWAKLRLPGPDAARVERWLRGDMLRGDGGKRPTAPGDLHVLLAADLPVATTSVRSLWHAGIRPCLLIVRVGQSSRDAMVAELTPVGYRFAFGTDRHVVLLVDDDADRISRASSIVRAAAAAIGDGRALHGSLSSEEMSSPLLLAYGTASRVMDDLDAERGKASFLRTRMQEVEFQRQSAESKVAALRLELELQGEQIAAAIAALEQLQGSRSWQMTKPLRVLRRLAGPERGRTIDLIASRVVGSRFGGFMLPLLHMIRGRRADRAADGVSGTPVATAGAQVSRPLSDRATEILAQLDEVALDIADGQGGSGT